MRYCSVAHGNNYTLISLPVSECQIDVCVPTSCEIMSYYSAKPLSGSQNFLVYLCAYMTMATLSLVM